MVAVEVVSFESGSSIKVEFVESLDIDVKKKITEVDVDSKIFNLNNWKDRVAIYQHNDNYGRNSSFEGKTVIYFNCVHVN